MRLPTPQPWCRMNTFICSDSSKPFSLIHGWKFLLLDAADWLFSQTDDAFEIITVECCTSYTTQQNREPLHSLLLAFGLSGWQTARNFCLGLLQKYCFILGWLALYSRCNIIFWKYPHKKVNEWNMEKGSACWKRLTPWKRLGLLKAPDSVAFKALSIT